MKWIRIALFSLSIFAMSIQANAQNLLSGKDLSTIKVDALTDAEIAQIQAQIKQAGVTIDMLESQAIAKGMSPAEFAKLKDRINGISGIVMAKAVKRTNINTQAVGTFTINAPTGTLSDGQKLMFRLQSTNIQTFSWDAVFDGSTDLNLPSTSSGSSKYDYMGFIYNTTATKWQILAKNFGF